MSQTTAGGLDLTKMDEIKISKFAAKKISGGQGRDLEKMSGGNWPKMEKVTRKKVWTLKTLHTSLT